MLSEKEIREDLKSAKIHLKTIGDSYISTSYSNTSYTLGYVAALTKVLSTQKTKISTLKNFFITWGDAWW